ncbi:hypothetical protein BGZ60DRAFT_424189 [Tricladium varicosporioides]|nr:hypothetical protein BGZ60DRAFT_424189 [Hymenoscyphus varicosporioides]
MSNPAIAGSILNKFAIVFGTAVGGVFAVDGILRIANRKQMEETRGGPLGAYNKNVQPQQDRLDTIFDRTKIMNDVKSKKPWNMTLAEKEAAKR